MSFDLDADFRLAAEAVFHVFGSHFQVLVDLRL